MATIQEIKKTCSAFAKNFQFDGFVVFDNHCGTAFEGTILVDYKGLRVVRMKKTQQQEQNITPEDLKAATLEAVKAGDKNNLNPTQILHHLKQKFEKCFCCVFTGKQILCDSAGEIVRVHMDGVTAFLF